MIPKFNIGDITIRDLLNTKKFNDETIKRLIVIVRDNSMYDYIWWNRYHCLPRSHMIRYEEGEVLYTDIFRELKNSY
jgi:hypothetical protein